MDSLEKEAQDILCRVLVRELQRHTFPGSYPIGDGDQATPQDSPAGSAASGKLPLEHKGIEHRI